MSSLNGNPYFGGSNSINLRNSFLLHSTTTEIVALSGRTVNCLQAINKGNHAQTTHYYLQIRDIHKR